MILEQGCKQLRDSSDPERIWMFVHDEEVQERFRNGTFVAFNVQSVHSMRQFVTLPLQPSGEIFSALMIDSTKIMLQSIVGIAVKIGGPENVILIVIIKQVPSSHENESPR